MSKDRFKFRAWHELGKMDEIPMQPGIIFDDKPGDCLRWKNEGQKILAVMQCTGLKDSSGTLIYEGDIVEFDTNADFDIKEGLHLTASVDWDFCDTGYYFNTTNGRYPYVKTYRAQNIKIIGNVHENPELLEGNE